MSVLEAALIFTRGSYHIVATGQNGTSCGIPHRLPRERAGMGVVTCAACRKTLSDNRSGSVILFTRDEDDGILHAALPVLFVAGSFPEGEPPIVRVLPELVLRCAPSYSANRREVEDASGATCLECLAFGETS